MMTLEDGREVVNPETFHYIEQTPVGLMGTMSAVFRGMLEAAEIVFLIFIFGACFGVIGETGAIEAGLVKASKALAGKEVVIIPVLMVIFFSNGRYHRFGGGLATLHPDLRKPGSFGTGL